MVLQIGTEFFRGVSGGERKRTNIGMELIIKPQVLFLDEPTTGLDAHTAVSVVKLLKRCILNIIIISLCNITMQYQYYSSITFNISQYSATPLTTLTHKYIAIPLFPSQPPPPPPPPPLPSPPPLPLCAG